MLSWLGHLIFWLVLVIGLVVIPFGLPGTFIMATAALIYGLLTDFTPIQFLDVVYLFGIAILGEVVEFLLGAFTAKRFGGSNWAMIGAIVGGFLGALWATGLMPIVGTLLGAFAGAFVGAFALEYLYRGKIHAAVKAGWGAMLGAIGGKITKIILGIAMLVLVMARFV